MTKPKRHHVVPECYLEGFTRTGLLWVYDRIANAFRPQTPKNTLVMGHYYAVVNADGDKDYGVEGFLSQLEGLGKPVILALEQGHEIGPEDRVTLAHFLALLFNRVPRFEREIEEMSDATTKLILKKMFPTVEAVASHLAKSPDPDRKYTPEDFFKFIHEEQFTVVGNRNITVRTMLEQTPKIARDIAMMNWEIIHTTTRHAFVTTDSAFGYLVPEHLREGGLPVYGIASPSISKVVALSRQTALVIGQPGIDLIHRRATCGEVRKINLAVATECERFVVGPDEALVRSVVRKAGLDEPGHVGTRMKVEHIQHPDDPNRTLLVSRRVPAEQFEKPLNVVFEE